MECPPKAYDARIRLLGNEGNRRRASDRARYPKCKTFYEFYDASDSTQDPSEEQWTQSSDQPAEPALRVPRRDYNDSVSSRHGVRAARTPATVIGRIAGGQTSPRRRTGAGGFRTTPRQNGSGGAFHPLGRQTAPNFHPFWLKLALPCPVAPRDPASTISGISLRYSHFGEFVLEIIDDVAFIDEAKAMSVTHG